MSFAIEMSDECHQKAPQAGGPPFPERPGVSGLDFFGGRSEKRGRLSAAAARPGRDGDGPGGQGRSGGATEKRPFFNSVRAAARGAKSGRTGGSDPYVLKVRKCQEFV